MLFRSPRAIIRVANCRASLFVRRLFYDVEILCRIVPLCVGSLSHFVPVCPGKTLFIMQENCAELRRYVPLRLFRFVSLCFASACISPVNQEDHIHPGKREDLFFVSPLPSSSAYQWQFFSFHRFMREGGTLANRKDSAGQVVEVV